MKICLVGGIFDRDASIRAKHAVTPETVLLEGLRNAGIDVDVVGHAHFQPSDAYDVVHVHHLGKAALKMASSGCRARFVFTGHNGPIVTGYEPSWFRRRAFRYVFEKSDAFVALSNAEAKHFANGHHARKVHCIPNGIPSETFASGEMLKNVAKGYFQILYVGQLIELKGVNLLLHAFRHIHQHARARLRLVYHNSALEDRYRQMARELAIDQDVDFVGILGPAELAREYAAADLLVLPSFAECLPSVITEALLCGTPVVATSVCGVPEQVGKYGRVTPPGDVPALIAAIEDMIRDQSHYRELAMEMRTYAEQKYHPKAMVEAHIALYRQLANQGRKATQLGAYWLDPMVRLAIATYWMRSRKGGTP